MKTILRLFVFLLLTTCVGFSSGKRAPLDPTLIIGKWKFDHSVTGGAVDTMRTELREMYYTFTKDSVFGLWIPWQGDTAKIPGTYTINAKRWKLRVETQSEPLNIQELTATTLVTWCNFKYENGRTVKYEEHYVKVK